MLCFRADAVLRIIGTLAPATLAAVEAGWTEGELDLGARRPGPSFRAAPRVSFDVGVLEKTDQAIIIAADFAWSDVGDWKEVWDALRQGRDGVVREGNVVATDSRDSYIRSEDGRLVCALGVEGLAVIDTADAPMTAHRKRIPARKPLALRVRGALRARLMRKVVGGSLAAFAIKVASAGLSFFMFVALARVMSRADYGIFAFGFSLATFLALVALLGQRTLALRMVPVYQAAGAPERLSFASSVLPWCFGPDDRVEDAEEAPHAGDEGDLLGASASTRPR